MSIAGGLRSEAGADCVEPTLWQASYVLRCSRMADKAERDWQPDKIDIADVGKQLAAVESELTEAPADVNVGVRGIRDRWLDPGRPGV